MCKKAGFEVTRIGVEGKEEEQFVRSVEDFLDLMGYEAVVNVASITNDVAALFREPDNILFNRNNIKIRVLMGDGNEDPKMLFFLKAAKYIIAELAHLEALKRSDHPDQLEHEKTTIIENELFKKLLERLGWDVWFRKE
jgi:hypothetical protein